MDVQPAQVCPQCRCRLLRVPRNLGDRCIALVVPVRRYRCAAAVCGWEGLFRQHDWPLVPSQDHANDLPGQVLDASRGFPSPHRSPKDV
jgi:hypothetical protein